MRPILLLGLLLSACSSVSGPAPQWRAYDGYGPSAPTIGTGYQVKRVSQNSIGTVTSSLETSDIRPALDEFMSPPGDALVLLPSRLDKSRLDYSLESLKVMDAWLRDIHTVNRLQADEGRAGEALISDGRGDNSVMFAGLYLGEVIRANSSLDWQWSRFDRFIAANPYFTEHYGFDPELDSFVLVGPQGVTTPINTALKRVLWGKEESLHFIGTLLVEPIDIDAATSAYDFYGITDVR